MEKEEKGEIDYNVDTSKWLLRPLLDEEAPLLLRANCVRSLALLANQSEAQREFISRSKDAPNIAKASLQIMNLMEKKMSSLKYDQDENISILSQRMANITKLHALSLMTSTMPVSTWSNRSRSRRQFGMRNVRDLERPLVDKDKPKSKINYSKILDVLYEGDTFEDPSRVELLESFCQTAANENTTRKSPPPPPPPPIEHDNDKGGGFFDLLDNSGSTKNDIDNNNEKNKPPPPMSYLTPQDVKQFEVPIPLPAPTSFKISQQIPPPPSPLQDEKRFETFFANNSGILHDRAQMPLSPYTKKLGPISPPKSRPKLPQMIHSVDRFIGRKKKKNRKQKQKSGIDLESSKKLQKQMSKRDDELLKTNSLN